MSIGSHVSYSQDKVLRCLQGTWQKLDEKYRHWFLILSSSEPSWGIYFKIKYILWLWLSYCDPVADGITLQTCNSDAPGSIPCISDFIFLLAMKLIEEYCWFKFNMFMHYKWLIKYSNKYFLLIWIKNLYQSCTVLSLAGVQKHKQICLCTLSLNCTSLSPWISWYMVFDWYDLTKCALKLYLLWRIHIQPLKKIEISIQDGINIELFNMQISPLSISLL